MARYYHKQHMQIFIIMHNVKSNKKIHNRFTRKWHKDETKISRTAMLLTIRNTNSISNKTRTRIVVDHAHRCCHEILIDRFTNK